jgi:hypothetical protein
MVVVSIVFVLVNLAVLFIGFLIRYRGMTWLIAGYDASRVRDEKGLAGWVGPGVMGIGAVGILVGGLIYALPDYTHILVIVFVVVAIGGVVTLMSGVGRFLKRA